MEHRTLQDLDDSRGHYPIEDWVCHHCRRRHTAGSKFDHPRVGRAGLPMARKMRAFMSWAPA